ncbi:hypothetical protein PHMEG_00021365 [Phytophthora megakarya]|uniref:Uncharacterized protein n=1 Tax=Phytophthora megakarya TaxID=4795 RepID=A0A225VM10_9STRA|nr:hypothetical protein PHMEG_00021365 [Phytophthora megakarya]
MPATSGSSKRHAGQMHVKIWDQVSSYQLHCLANERFWSGVSLKPAVTACHVRACTDFRLYITLICRDDTIPDPAGAATEPWLSSIPGQYPAQKHSEGTRRVARPGAGHKPYLAVARARRHVVDKGNEDISTSGCTIHDLSYSDGVSVSDYTDQTSTTKPDYVHCDAVATEGSSSEARTPNAEIDVMAGDVASAFRNNSIHSNIVFLFTGHIKEENVIVIDLITPFG